MTDEGADVKTPEEKPPDETVTPDRGRAKRSWKSRLIELALWAALSIATALIMIALSDKLLPTNF
jgi:hypothetical protein